MAAQADAQGRIGVSSISEPKTDFAIELDEHAAAEQTRAIGLLRGNPRAQAIQAALMQAPPAGIYLK
jgi:hypothetical protein